MWNVKRSNGSDSFNGIKMYFCFLELQVVIAKKFALGLITRYYYTCVRLFNYLNKKLLYMYKVA